MSTMNVNAILDSAGGNTATINGITPALASQAQAETGTDNTTLMTPLRAAQALSAQSKVLLGTLTTTSGATQTLSSLTLTNYNYLLCLFDGVSATAQTTVSLGGVQVSSQLATVAQVWTGVVNVVLETGLFWSALGNNNTLCDVRSADTAISNATTSLTFSLGTGTFDAGSIRVYGIM